jgi:hypothetical protein
MLFPVAPAAGARKGKASLPVPATVMMPFQVVAIVAMFSAPVGIGDHNCGRATCSCFQIRGGVIVWTTVGVNISHIDLTIRIIAALTIKPPPYGAR